MAVIKVRKPVSVDKIFAHVACPLCEKEFNFKMRGEETRKVCPHCSRLTFIFTVTPIRGYINVQAKVVGPDQYPHEYTLEATDIEVEYDEDEDPGPMFEE